MYNPRSVRDVLSLVNLKMKYHMNKDEVSFVEVNIEICCSCFLALLKLKGKVITEQENPKKGKILSKSSKINIICSKHR